MSSNEGASALPDFNPKDWRIISTAPGNQELSFVNDKLKLSTWYYPEGATAAQIMQIPDAKRWFPVDEEAIVAYMQKMDAERAKYASAGDAAYWTTA